MINSTTEKINTLIRENKITDDEIFADNNVSLQNDIKMSESMALIEGNTSYPNNNFLYNHLLETPKPKPKPKPRVAKPRTARTKNAKTLSVPFPKVGAVPKVAPKPRAITRATSKVKEDPKLLEMKQQSIGLFEIEMDELDDADKIKHKKDTPNVSSEIVALKNEYLHEFTLELNKISSKKYDEEEQKLMTDQLNFFNKDLKDIRRRSQFELEMDNLDHADKLQHKEKNTDDIMSKIATLKKEYLLVFTEELNMLFYNEDVKASNLMKKTLQYFSEKLQNIRKQAHFTYNKRMQTRVKVRRDLKPKARTLSKPLNVGTGTGTGTDLNSVINLKKNKNTNKNKNKNVIQNPLQINVLPNPNSKKTLKPRSKKVNASKNTANALHTSRQRRVHVSQKIAPKTHIEEYANKVKAMLQTIDLTKLSIPPSVKSTSPINRPKTTRLTPKYLKVRL